MKIQRRLILATDFSASAGHALPRSVGLAQAHRVGLDLLHAFGSGARRALQAMFDARRPSGEVPDGVAARQHLAALAESLAIEPGLTVAALCEVGDPAAALATPVKKSDAAAVDLREVSQRAAAVDPFAAAEHRMLGVIDPAWEHERSRQSAPQAASGDGSEGPHAIAVNRLDEVARVLSLAGERRVEAEVANGLPARILVQRAAQWPADGVAVGRHGQGSISERLLASTALDLIQHTARDVPVVS